MGLQVNPEQMGAVALFVVALLSGLGRSVELSVSAEQYEMVRSAAANADRWGARLEYVPKTVLYLTSHA